MRVIFVGGPRHREEQTVMFVATMEMGGYRRYFESDPNPSDKDWWDVETSYFVHRDMNREIARAAVHKQRRDEPEALQ